MEEEDLAGKPTQTYSNNWTQLQCHFRLNVSLIIIEPVILINTTREDRTRYGWMAREKKKE